MTSSHYRQVVLLGLATWNRRSRPRIADSATMRAHAASNPGLTPPRRHLAMPAAGSRPEPRSSRKGPLLSWDAPGGARGRQDAMADLSRSGRSAPEADVIAPPLPITGNIGQLLVEGHARPVSFVAPVGHPYDDLDN